MSRHFYLTAGLPQFTNGKTMHCLDVMKKMCDAAITDSRKETVHFIFANNNLVEVENWKSKMTRNGNHFAISSSRTRIKPKELCYDIVTNTLRYILMCTHPKRLDQTFNVVIQELCTHYRDRFQVAVWFDEFHENHHMIRPFLQEIYPNVVRYTGITATPTQEMWNTLVDCNFSEDVSLDHTYTEEARKMYQSVIDHKHIDTPENIHSQKDLLIEVLNHREKYKVTNNSILFVPGKFQTKTHEEIKNIAQQYKCNAVLINGTTKTIQYWNGRSEELNKKNNQEGVIYTLAKLYNTSNELKQHPLIITGYKCISTGVTINLPNFQVTHALFYKNAARTEDMVQLMHRMAGHRNCVRTDMLVICDKESWDSVERYTKIMENFLRKGEKIMNQKSLSVSNIPSHNEEKEEFKQDPEWLKDEVLLQVTKDFVEKCLQQKNYKNQKNYTKLINNLRYDQEYTKEQLHLLFKSETVGYRNPRIDKVEALFGREGAFFVKERILVMQQYCINGMMRYKIRPELEELFNN
jgi:hypothetical protein